MMNSHFELELYEFERLKNKFRLSPLEEISIGRKGKIKISDEFTNVDEIHGLFFVDERSGRQRLFYKNLGKHGTGIGSRSLSNLRYRDSLRFILINDRIEKVVESRKILRLLSKGYGWINLTEDDILYLSPLSYQIEDLGNLPRIEIFYRRS